VDAIEEEHRRQALAWLDSTGDIFRAFEVNRDTVTR
jgi:hypothetical protein